MPLPHPSLSPEDQSEPWPSIPGQPLQLSPGLPPAPCLTPAHFPLRPLSQRTNKKTNPAVGREGRGEGRGGGGGGGCSKRSREVAFISPASLIPTLIPRSASCQPGCSQADIAAGAFSAAFPQICLLQGLLKRSPRFLCYSRLHSLPSSKARAPGGLGGEGAAGGQCQA